MSFLALPYGHPTYKSLYILKCKSEMKEDNTTDLAFVYRKKKKQTKQPNISLAYV